MSTARWMHSHHLLGLWVPTAESKPFSPPWVTLSLPVPLPPTGQFGVGTRGWSHISFPLSSHSKLQGNCQRTGEQGTPEVLGPWPLLKTQHSSPLHPTSPTWMDSKVRTPFSQALRISSMAAEMLRHTSCHFICLLEQDGDSDTAVGPEELGWGLPPGLAGWALTPASSQRNC